MVTFVLLWTVVSASPLKQRLHRISMELERKKELELMKLELLEKLNLSKPPVPNGVERTQIPNTVIEKFMEERQEEEKKRLKEEDVIIMANISEFLI